MILHQETITEVPEEQPVPSCSHYWIIEPANGPTSRGVCRNCHESKVFNNSVVEAERESHDLRPLVEIDKPLAKSGSAQ